MSDHASRRVRRFLTAPPAPLETRLAESGLLAPEPPSPARRRAAEASAWVVLIGLVGLGAWNLQWRTVDGVNWFAIVVGGSVVALFATVMAAMLYAALLGTTHGPPRRRTAAGVPTVGDPGAAGLRLHASTGRPPSVAARGLDADDRW